MKKYILIFLIFYINETLNIYDNNSPLKPYKYKLDFKGLKGGILHIKQFYDTNNDKIFFGITIDNYLFFNKYVYLISIDKNNNYYTLCNPLIFKDLYIKNTPSIPLFKTYNNQLSLELVNLAGKHSKKYLYIFTYNKNTNKYNIIDKGFIYFNFDKLKNKK